MGLADDVVFVLKVRHGTINTINLDQIKYAAGITIREILIQQAFIQFCLV